MMTSFLTLRARWAGIFCKLQRIRCASSTFVVKSSMNLQFDEKSLRMSFPKFMLEDIIQSKRGDLTAVVDGSTNNSLTFREVYTCSFQIGNSLRKLNIRHGSCVALLSPNHLHYVPTYLGIGLTGACTTPINPSYTEEEIAFQLESTRASLLVSHPSCLDKALKVAGRFSIPVISLGEDSSKNVICTLPQILEKEKFESIDVESFPGNGTDGFDSTTLFSIPFSSGTTGIPKGVMLTHRNMIANVLQVMPFDGENMKATARDSAATVLCPLPCFHIYGIIVAIMTMRAGAKFVFMPSFDLVRFLELIQEQRVTHAFVVPPIVIALAKHPVVLNYDLRSLRTVVSGAAPLGSDIQSLCANRLNCIVKQGWGMTELSPVATVMPDSAITSIDAIHGSSGMLVPQTEARIVDPLNGRDLPCSEEGEILIRGPQVMKGYLNNEEATNQVLTADGWLHTGDVGHFNSQGWLYVTDRCKELIKYKGFQVAPAELEALLLSMPGVKDCVVIPVLDEEAGEVPRAYVVRQDHLKIEDLTEETILHFVDSHVAPHKRLRGGVRFTDVIPKSPSGKILRRVQIERDRATKSDR